MKIPPKAQPLRALLIEDSEDDAILLIEALRHGGYEPDWKRVDTEPALRAALTEHEWDVVFCDYSMPKLDAPTALRVLRESGDTLTAIVVSGKVGEYVAVEAMRLGANDFILKHNLARVPPVVERELRAAELRRERSASAESLRKSEERYRALFDALQESEARFRGAFEQAAVGMAHVSTRGEFLQVNDKLCEIVGYERADLRGMTFIEMTAPQDRAEGQAAVGAMLAGTMRSYATEKRYMRKDGETVWVNLATTLQRGATGEPLYFITVFEDITARKNAEDALRSGEREQQRLYRQLEEERARLVAAQAVAKVGSWETNLSTMEVLWSAETYRIFEAASGSFSPTHETFLQMVHPDDRATVHDAFVQSLDHKSRNAINHRILMPDGRIKYLEELWQVMHDAQGKPSGAIGTCQDVTEEEQAREALRLSEERFRQMAENSGEVFWLTDASKMEVLYVSPAYETVWGRTCESLLAAPTAASILDTIHPDDQKRVDKAFLLPMDTNVDVTYRIIHPDGTLRWIHHRAYPVRDGNGKIYRLAGIATDITEATEAEEKIREQAALLDHARDAIHVQDTEGYIKYWNKGAERAFGWTNAEAVGRKMQDLTCEHEDAYESALEATLRLGGWVGELGTVTKTGAHVLVEARWTLMEQAADGSKLILAINTDITEKRNLEAQFFRAQRMESIGTLAGGIAHDLNNVLGPIIMAVDLLNMTVTDPRDRDLLELMETSARRGADMVKQVLYFARGIEGHRTLVPPALLVKDLQRIARDTFPKSIVVDGDVPPATWSTEVDRTQIHQVLLNLCVNARDAMPHGGHLQISARNRTIDAQFAAMNPRAYPGAYVVFEVTDNGEGMAPEVMDRIFEPFFTTKEIGKGTGLGLSTTHAIVKSHGGFLTVKSEPGRGTTFEVNIPAETGLSEAQAETASLELPRGNGELILIIDDEAAIRSITGQTLEAFGYRVMSAGDGAEGVSKYAQHMESISAVLTDMMMPVMDGVATIRVLRRLKAGVKIIAASGLTSKVAEEQAEVAGVDCFLPKPYAAEALLRALNKLLHPET